MPTVATPIQPLNSLPIINLKGGEMTTQKVAEESLIVNIPIPSKVMIQQDPALYTQYIIDCINRIRGDFHSLCINNFPEISNQLNVLSDKTTNLKQEISERFGSLSTDNRDIRSKLDVLAREIEYNKVMLERAIDEIGRNRQYMEERILQSMNEVMQQNNERFDMLSEQINMLTGQGYKLRDTTALDLLSQSANSNIEQNQKNNPVMQRGAYTKQEIDDKTLFSMSVDDLMKLRNNITSTKSRNKPLATGETNGIYEMCVANMDKINKRIQQLRQQ